MKEVHLICNAHIDPVWQWDWPEGVGAILSTFRSAAELADEFDYIFCHNEASAYRYVEVYAPDLFERIKQLVKKKKWHIMGGWYLQPDCNMPSGESFVRQILVGQKYFEEKFGIKPTTAINFDPFGHTRGLVQIMRKCGQDSYMVCRPSKFQLPLEKENFLWEGFDGSTVKVLRSETYNTPLGESAKAIKERIDRQGENSACVLWGVGNHGGGPSKKDLAEIELLMKEDGQEIFHSTPENFFSGSEPQYRFDKSLLISMPGCYTSMSLLKIKHIELENQLYMTEKMLSVASLKGLIEYPQEQLDVVVEDLLSAEFHDILPGTSIRAGEKHGLALLDHGLLEIDKLKNRAFFALATNLSVAKEGEIPILVFNPNAYEFETEIECEFMLAEQNWSETLVSKIILMDESGNTLPCQEIKEESNLSLDWRKRIVFRGKLRPLDITRFSVTVSFEKKVKKISPDSFVYRDGHKFVEIDRKSGLLKSFQTDGREWVKDAFLPIMFSDTPDPWGMSEKELKRMGTCGEAFELSKGESGIFKGLESVRVIEDGEIYLSVEAFFEKERTAARIVYKIYKAADYIDVDVDLFFGEADKFVKLAIPFACGGNLIGQTAFGYQELFEDGRENVAHRFVALKGEEGCIAVLNDCQYAGHFENGTLYLSLTRGVSYCAHPILDRPLIPSDRFVKKIDQGERNFHFRLLPAQENELERLAQEFNQKPYSLNVFPLGYCKTTRKMKISIDNKNVCIVTIKKNQSGKGYIFRLLNNSCKEADTVLTIGREKLTVHLKKYEVKTVVFTEGKATEAERLII